MFGFLPVFSVVVLCVATANAIPPGNDLVARAFPPAPDLTVASWIWTTTAGISGVPPGTSTFRLTFKPDPTLPLANISVAISADNAYNFYFNGTLYGSGYNWQSPNIWTINNVPSTEPWVFSIVATNYAVGLDDLSVNPAGMIASFVASSASLQKSYTWFTGQPANTWKATGLVLDNFYSPTLDDSAWPPAVFETVHGGGPWGVLPPPNTACRVN
ncbi:hypothetical protein R3P38DRAFT_2768140 [Favolaschia claudopus]|uniref:Uncharacterized protein n=1 Tax=Favolaschia claudopus TaxID=2862362 RepID=A0AAW0CWI7_9AGAR